MLSKLTAADFFLMWDRIKNKHSLLIRPEELLPNFIFYISLTNREQTSKFTAMIFPHIMLLFSKPVHKSD